MKEHLKLLGFKVRDLITDREGVVCSISFDVSGCVQAYIQPAIDKDGKVADGAWIDTKRLTAADKQPVMELPDFVTVPGGSDLPALPTKSAPR